MTPGRPGAPDSGRAAAVVVAAGRGTRFGGPKKEYRPLGDGVVLDASLRLFLESPGYSPVVLVVPPGGAAEALRAMAPALAALAGGRLLLVEGGAERADSVRAALEALDALGPEAPDHVLVHDAARPWASPALAAAVLAGARASGACVPGTPPVDTVKVLGADGTIAEHPPRAALVAAQTPQGFRFRGLLEAHRAAAAAGIAATDDAEVWARAGLGPVAVVPGERANRKITFPEDLEP